MKDNVFLGLLKKHAIGVDNIVTANYTVTDLFGRTFNKTNEFKIVNIVNTSTEIKFDLISLDDNKTIQMDSESIVFIDGMDIERYADIYDLLPDGTDKKVGKKRGRKSKNCNQTDLIE